jgi:O-glycosyl hydrolase
MKLCTGSATAFLVVFMAGSTAASVLKVDPLIRYQEYLGVGGTLGGAINNDLYVSDMGCNVVRVHLEKDGHLDLVKAVKSHADSKGKQLTIIASIWTPPGHMKIGPYYNGGCVDGANMCGGTLDPAKYTEFGNWVNEKLDRYKNAGIPIHGLSLQNEPWLDIWYISCTYDQQQYINMFKNVAPIVKSRHPDVKLMIAEMWLGPSQLEIALMRTPEAAKNVDVLAWHGHSYVASDMSARHDGAVAKAWKARHAVASADNLKFRPVWQTECNLLCGWTTMGNCSWGGAYETSGPAFPEGCNMLALFRYGYGQLWTTYWIHSEFQDNKRRNVYRHFGRYLETGAEMIACEQDTVNDIATVAFHHKNHKTLTIVTVKGKTGTSSVSFKIPGLSTPGKWYMSDNNLDFADQGAISSDQSVTLNGQSMATMYWENYNPDISAAVYPLQKGATQTTMDKVPSRGLRDARVSNHAQVYDLHGRLVGTSQARFFGKGVLIAVEENRTMYLRHTGAGR